MITDSLILILLHSKGPVMNFQISLVLIHVKVEQSCRFLVFVWFLFFFLSWSVRSLGCFPTEE